VLKQVEDNRQNVTQSQFLNSAETLTLSKLKEMSFTHVTLYINFVDSFQLIWRLLFSLCSQSTVSHLIQKSRLRITLELQMSDLSIHRKGPRQIVSTT